MENNCSNPTFSGKSCARDGCDKEVLSTDARTKYCSRSCAAKVNNSKHPKRPKGRTTIRNCVNCGEVLQSRQAKKYCSRACKREKYRADYIDLWLAGKVDGTSGKKVPQLSSIARNYLLTRSGNRCESPTCCVPGGWSVPNPVTGRPILTVEHLDGNWRNNSVDNLIVLCYNCHTLTETFGSLNKGNQLVNVSRRSAEGR